MTELTVVLLQLDVAFGQPAENYRKVRQLFAEAQLQAGEVVVLPELWNTAYDLKRLPVIADENGRETTTFLQELAQRYQVTIVGGSVARGVAGKFYNTLYVVDEKGATDYYDKVHLFRPMQEERYFTAGGQLLEREIAGVACGFGICYDLRFPEFFRRLAVAGTEVFIVPAQWPQQRLAHWRKLLQVRALENQAFVIGVNRVGVDPANVFGGHSLVADPWGEILLELPETPAFERISLDLTQVAAARQALPILQDRRPDLY